MKVIWLTQPPFSNLDNAEQYSSISWFASYNTEEEIEIIDWIPNNVFDTCLSGNIDVAVTHTSSRNRKTNTNNATNVLEKMYSYP